MSARHPLQLVCDEEPLICCYCGEPEIAQLLEVWSPRDFQVETCCEGMHHEVCEFLAADPKRAAHWLNSQGLAGGVRRVIDDGCGHLVLDWHLEIAEVTQKEAKAFVKLHHRHCDPPAGWRFGASIKNGPGPDGVIGVVMVGRPVAKAFDKNKVVEVNRLAVREDLAAGLQWNACSMALGFAAREARTRGFEKIITYTLATEPGTSLIAAGWVQEARVKGRSWNTASRPRADPKEIVDKIRWSRALRPSTNGAGIAC